MAVIQSVAMPRVTWHIHNSDSLTADEIQFIEQFDPPVFFNDRTGVTWTFDVKMPSGRWFENITFANDLSTARALILPKEEHA